MKIISCFLILLLVAYSFVFYFRNEKRIKNDKIDFSYWDVDGVYVIPNYSFKNIKKKIGKDMLNLLETFHGFCFAVFILGLTGYVFCEGIIYIIHKVIKWI